MKHQSFYQSLNHDWFKSTFQQLKKHEYIYQSIYKNKIQIFVRMWNPVLKYLQGSEV